MKARPPASQPPGSERVQLQLKREQHLYNHLWSLFIVLSLEKGLAEHRVLREWCSVPRYIEICQRTVVSDSSIYGALFFT